jgi:hypothetical protein
VAAAAISTSLGQLEIDAGVDLSYGWAGGPWAQTIQASARLSWNVFDETEGDVSSTLVVAAGVAPLAQLVDSTPFILATSLGIRSWSTYLGIPAQVGYSWQRSGGRLDFNPPLAVQAQLFGVAWLPLSWAQFQAQVGLVLSANLPITAHSVVKLGLKAEQFLPGDYYAYLDIVTAPRGFASWIRYAPGGLLGSVDWLVPLGLLDVPLPFGWGLTGAGLGVHVEGTGEYDTRTGWFAIRPVIFLGADVSVRLAYEETSFPVGMGIAAALNTPTWYFNPATDIGVYFFAGFDSFTALARQGSQAVPAQGR